MNGNQEDVKKFWDLASKLKEFNETKRRLESEIKSLNGSIEFLQSQMVDLNDKNGWKSNSFTFPDGVKGHFRTSLYLSKKAESSQLEVAEILIKEKMNDFLSCNTSGLKSFIKEQLEHCDNPNVEPLDVLPESLRDHFNVFEKTIVVISR